MKYLLRLCFDNDSEKVISLDSDLPLEEVAGALYAFFQGRSPVANIVINPNRLLLIQISQLQSEGDELVSLQEETVAG